MTLQRKTPLRSRPKGKGNSGEREVVDILRARGWTEARRNFASGGQGGGDVIGGPGDTHIEVKRTERCAIWSWLEQATSDARPTDMPLVAFRRNHSGWMACVPLEDLLDLIALRERS